MLTELEWKHINKIILTLYTQKDSTKLRHIFLEQLRHLIMFNLAEFSIGDNLNKFKDSVEINMDNDDPPNFMVKYFEYLNMYGNRSIDWIFRYPESTVVRVEEIIREEYFEESNFKKIYLRSIAMEHCCTTTLYVEGNYVGEFSLYLAEGYGIFTDRDLYILNELKEHLANKLYDLNQPKTLFLSSKELEYFRNYTLTDRELDVLRPVINGDTYENIAGILYISVNTVRKHLDSIYRKLAVHSRSELLKFYQDVVQNR